MTNHPAQDRSTTHDAAASRGWLFLALLPAGFLLLALPLWALRFMRGRGAYDQHYYHIKAVRRFAEQWPRFDFSEYESATTPGYHVFLAAVSRIIGDTPVVLQIVGSVFTIAFLALAGLMIAHRAARSGVAPITAACLSLPLICSVYVMFPGVWIQPDNAGWLGVLVILALALEPRRGASWFFAAGCVLAALVMVRQSHLWVTAVFWLAAWLNAAPGVFDKPTRRLPSAALAFVLTLPALGILFWFYKLWSGLIPPNFKEAIPPGMNYATPAFILSLIACYSIFLVAWLWEGLVTLWRESRPVIFIAASLGAFVAAIPETTFLAHSRKGGLWNLTQIEDRFHLTIAHHTSPLILILSTLGAVCVAAWLVRLAARDRLIFATALLAFTAAQTANANCWQRYIEPLLLILLPLMAVSAVRPIGAPTLDPRCEARLAPLRILGPLALALALAAITAHGLITGEPMRW